MEFRNHRRLIAGIFAVCSGLLAPTISGLIFNRVFQLPGIPVMIGFVAIAFLGAVLAVRISRMESWKYMLLYGVLALGSAFLRFIYIFSQTQA